MSLAQRREGFVTMVPFHTQGKHICVVFPSVFLHTDHTPGLPQRGREAAEQDTQRERRDLPQHLGWAPTGALTETPRETQRVQIRESQ